MSAPSFTNRDQLKAWTEARLRKAGFNHKERIKALSEIREVCIDHLHLPFVERLIP
jgi:hypothetical protein